MAKGDLRGVPGGSPAGGRPAKTMVCCCPAPEEADTRFGHYSQLRKGLLWILRFPMSHTLILVFRSPG